MKRVETIATDSDYPPCDLYEILKDRRGYHLISPEGRSFTAKAGQRQIVAGPFLTIEEARAAAPVCEGCDYPHAGECSAMKDFHDAMNTSRQ